MDFLRYVLNLKATSIEYFAALTKATRIRQEYFDYKQRGDKK